jgi:hypothetical protein
MKKAVLFVGLLVLAMGTVAAADNFTVDATEFAKLMLNNTIAQMDQGQTLLAIMASAENAGALNYSNVWGVIYGGMVLTSVNNQITGLVLNAILTNNSAHASIPLYAIVGQAVNMLGQNATEVFGDSGGTKGLYKLLNAQLTVLKDSISSGYPYLQEYATELAETMWAGSVFFIELAKAIAQTFS